MKIPDDALVIGLGGNVGDVRATFVKAREALGRLGDVKSAALYRTAPVGPAQPDFLNSAVRVRLADATPEEIIQTVLEIERLLGRDRHSEVRWGPRAIDLDVLVWGTRTGRWPGLELPHPRLHERRFALAPLVDLYGEDVLVPGTNATAGALYARLTTQAIERIAEAW